MPPAISVVAYAGRERAQRAIGAGMEISANDAVTWAYYPLLGEYSVFNSHLAHVKEIFNVILIGKIPTAALLRRFNILIGSKVIHDQRNPVFVKHGRSAAFLKLIDRHR